MQETGRTVTAWMTPFSRMEEAISSNASGLKRVRFVAERMISVTSNGWIFSVVVVFFMGGLAV